MSVLAFYIFIITIFIFKNELRSYLSFSFMQILHISDVEVRETKMMGETPIIIVVVGISLAFSSFSLYLSVNFGKTSWYGSFPSNLSQFQTQEVYCIRDKLGSITEGGKVNVIPVIFLLSLLGTIHSRIVRLSYLSLVWETIN